MNKMQYRLYNALKPPSSFKDATNIVRQHPLYPNMWQILYKNKHICTILHDRSELLVHSADSPAEISRLQAVVCTKPMSIFCAVGLSKEACRLVKKGMSMKETKSLRGEI